NELFLQQFLLNNDEKSKNDDDEDLLNEYSYHSRNLQKSKPSLSLEALGIQKNIKNILRSPPIFDVGKKTMYAPLARIEYDVPVKVFSASLLDPKNVECKCLFIYLFIYIYFFFKKIKIKIKQ